MEIRNQLKFLNQEIDVKKKLELLDIFYLTSKCTNKALLIFRRKDNKMLSFELVIFHITIYLWLSKLRLSTVMYICDFET